VTKKASPRWGGGETVAKRLRYWAPGIRRLGVEGGPCEEIARDMIEAARSLGSENYPTPDAYEAACRALAHWRKEARRLGRIAKVTPREMNPSKP
jgi:hypothetical protein